MLREQALVRHNSFLSNLNMTKDQLNINTKGMLRKIREKIFDKKVGKLTWLKRNAHVGDLADFEDAVPLARCAARYLDLGQVNLALRTCGDKTTIIKR